MQVINYSLRPRLIVTVLLRHFVWLTASDEAHDMVGPAVVAKGRRVLLEQEAAVDGALQVVQNGMPAGHEAWGSVDPRGRVLWL